MTLAKNERSEVRSVSGIIPEAKRMGISLISGKQYPEACPLVHAWDK
jgi:hypothetical protein